MVASDAVLPGTATALERRAGAGAVACLIGGDTGAIIGARVTRTRPVLDRYRGAREAATRDPYDARLFRDAIYLPALREVVEHLAVFDPNVWSLPDPDDRSARAVARDLNGTLVSDAVYSAVGDTGAAAALLGVVAGLDAAGVAAVVAYGGGRTTGLLIEANAPVPGASLVPASLAGGTPTTYVDALRARGQLTPAGETVEMGVPPGSAMFTRGGAEMLGPLGARCVDCDTVNTPPSIHPHCVQCGGTKFEEVTLATSGTVHTYVVNRTMPAPFVAPTPVGGGGPRRWVAGHAPGRGRSRGLGDRHARRAGPAALRLRTWSTRVRIQGAHLDRARQVTMGWNRVAVVGAGLVKFGELFDSSYEHLASGAFDAAVANVDRSFEPAQVEAAFVATQRGTLWGQEGIGGNTVPSALGLAGIPCTRIENACPSGSDAFRVGAMAVASGVHDIVLVIGVEKMRDKSTEEGLLSRAAAGHPIYTRGETAPVLFAPFATRHMHEFGTTPEMLASVAVKNHHNGALDPYAHFRNEITSDQVLNSPMVCEPLRLLDCCPQTDGAAATLLVNAERAGEFTDAPVYVAGFGVATDHPYLHEKSSFTGLQATTMAAERAYDMAGLVPADIDMAEVHDCFTITEILDIEDLGFVEKGKGGFASLEGQTALDGRIPVNTSGGLLAKGHPIGATGVAQLTECWWQLRGEADQRQVEIRNGNALQHNVGGRGSGVSVVNILTTNP
ncbi:MAG: thiolase domain-containing protein [Acidimicrobiia bacterium]|nr:thiolase domain-containing protein [Acidimicrobiia bacterium]